MKFLLPTALGAAMFACWMLTGPDVTAAPGGDVVVRGRVFNGYQRTKLADGTFKPERYGVAKGGRWSRAAVDPSVDGLSFPDILRTIAGPLRLQGYLPSSDPQRTDLLILVFWGTTTGATDGDYDHALPGILDAIARQGRADPGAGNALTTAMMFQTMENRARDRNNGANAGILGYTDAYVRARDLRQFGLSWGDSTIGELEANRYFVVLKAYDFPYALRERKLRLLWEARYSIYEQGNRFDQQLLAMTQAAAPWFGQDTGGLVHRGAPTGNVDVGTPRVIEMPAKPDPGAKR